jgi:hypothetical protein
MTYEFKNTKTLSLKITSLQALSLVRANWVHRYIIDDTKESQKLCRADFSADNRRNRIFIRARLHSMLGVN